MQDARVVLAGLGSARTPWLAVALADADRLAGLFEAAFGLADPVAAALRAGLDVRRTATG